MKKSVRNIRKFKKEIYSAIGLMFLSFALILIMPFNLGTFVFNGNLDSTPKSWGFQKHLGSFPTVPDKITSVVKENGGIWRGNEKEKVMYMTFDCGYELGYTPKILEALKKTDTKACFFVTGQMLTENPDLIKQMIAEGHIIGNHTVKHKSMAKSSESTINDELNGLNEKYKTITGEKESMKYMRPPKGEYTTKALKIAKDLGYTTTFWSIAYVDWEDNNSLAKESAMKKVTEQFHNGAIILLHNTSRTNSEILEDLINKAKKDGYSFKPLTEFK